MMWLGGGVGSPGAVAIYVTGRVLGMRKISDFSGNYRASIAWATIAGDGLAAYLRNERGVVTERIAMDAETAANGSVNGVRVRLKCLTGAPIQVSLSASWSPTIRGPNTYPRLRTLQERENAR
jgi:hypothetical protein